MLKDFRVGTFNLFNLVLPETPFYGNRIYSEKEFGLKTAWIGEQLKRMNADIIGFQEVFHEEALREVLKMSGVYEDVHIVSAKPQGRYPAVGLASRFPIRRFEIIKDFPEVLDFEGMDLPIKKFRRPLLKVEVILSAKLTVTCFVIHLKSKRPIFPEDKSVDRNDPVERAKGQVRALILRAAEAVAFRAVLVNAMKKTKAPVIVMGDVNDSGMAVTTRVVSGEPPYRSMPHNQKKAIWDVLLYHVKDVQARKSYQDFYYTHIHNGHHESLDHIMVSEEFVKENPNRVGQVGYVRVFNDHLIDETLSTERPDNWRSDHGQVVVEIELD